MNNNNSWKQVIILRKDLNMPKGKLVAQGAHASFDALMTLREHPNWGKAYIVLPDTGPVNHWLATGATKVVVYVKSEEELVVLHEKAKAAGISTALVVDEGRTMFDGVKTRTAVAIGPDESAKIDPITEHLPLL